MAAFFPPMLLRLFGENLNGGEDDSLEDQEFRGTLKNDFIGYIDWHYDSLSDLTSVDDIFRPFVDGTGDEKFLKLIRNGFRPLLHAVVATGCSLVTVQFVYDLQPSVIEDFDDDGLLPLHAALLYVRSSNDSFSWDVIRFLIDKHPAALGRRERCTCPSEGMLPLHALLDRYHLEPTRDTMYKEHMDLFLRPGYEYTMLEAFRRMYDPRLDSSGRLPSYRPVGFHIGARFALYFIKRQLHYGSQFIGVQTMYRWIRRLSVHLLFEPADMALFCDTLLVRIPSMDNMTVLRVACNGWNSLELCVMMMEQLEAAMIHFSTTSTPIAALADDDGDTPLHDRPLAEYGHIIVPRFIQGFPGILHYRNNAGLTPFQSCSLQEDDHEEWQLDFLYTLLRSDPAGTISESFLPLSEVARRVLRRSRRIRRKQPLQPSNQAHPSGSAVKKRRGEL